MSSLGASIGVVDVVHGIPVVGHHLEHSILNANHMANGAITNIGF